MRKQFLLNIIILNCFFVQITSFAFTGSGEIKFQNISVKEGLSHIGVTSVYQDSEGFIWASTFDGLNRFDGKSFKVFRNSLSDSTSIINSRVQTIQEHSSGRLYIGTDAGICVYNRQLQRFERTGNKTLDDLNTRISRISEDSENRLWILTESGKAFVYNLKNNVCSEISFEQKKTSNLSYIINFCEDKYGNFWVLTGGGLINCDFNLRINQIFKREVLGTKWLSICKTDKNGYLYLAGSDGIKKFKIKTGESISLEKESEYLGGQNIRRLLIDTKMNIWAAIPGEGINIIRHFNENQTEIIKLSNDLNDNTSLCSNSVSSMFEDKEGNIWIGTIDNGISVFKSQSNRVFAYSRKNGLPEDYIPSIVLYDETKIICGTRKRGVFAFNYKKNLVEPLWFTLNKNDVTVIECMYKDSRENLWIGRGSGLYRLKHGEKFLKPVVEFNKTIRAPKVIYDIKEDDFGFIWIGCRRGLFRIEVDEENKIVKSLKFNFSQHEDFVIRRVYNDPIDNSLWIGTWYNGLLKIETNNNKKQLLNLKYEQFANNEQSNYTLGSNFVSGIFRDSKNRLWVATEGGGISELVKKGDKIVIINYGEREGLSNNVCKGIAESKNGNLYIATNNKLNEFNTENLSFNSITEEDGLLSHFFTSDAVTLPDGRLVFAGNKGLTFLNSDLKNEELDLAQIHFGDFLLFGDVVKPESMVNNRNLLQQGLDYTKQIELEHNENVFAIDLITTNYKNAQSGKLKYRLIGFDEKWRTVNGSSFTAEYVKVPPGKYVFEFTAAVSKDNWIEPSKTFNIKISPPIWLTFWAKLFYLLLFSAVLILVYRYLWKIERLKTSIQIEKFEKQKVYELTEEKIKFFTNIAHDFKTPLSLINGPLDNLLAKHTVNDNTRFNLLRMKNQVSYLLLLLDQLIEFRRIKNDKLNLSCYEINILDFIWNIKIGFDDLSVKKQIKFNFEKNTDKILMWIDPRKFEKIIYNLLSNAFKHAPENGFVSIKIEKQEELVRISVSDSGLGVAEDEINQVFDRFYKGKSTNIQGAGIGLSIVKSIVEAHKGSIKVFNSPEGGAVFEIELLLGKEHISTDMLGTKNNKQEPSLIYQNLNNTLEYSIDARPTSRDHIIYIVEDVAEMRDFIGELFSSEYKVYKFKNGQLALNNIKTIVPDLIISDLNMPVMDGIELCKYVKSNKLTAHIPFILLTSKSEVKNKIVGFDIGAIDYITKPFSNEFLKARVSNIISEVQSIKSRYADSLKEDEYVKPVNSKEREFLYSFLQVLQQQYGNPDLNINIISSNLNVSKTKLLVTIKNLTGKTPIEIIRNYRIKKSVIMLKSSDDAISNIMQDCGFKSRAYFYKCFKEKYHMTPKEFRESLSKK